jgi:hypothetical protein
MALAPAIASAATQAYRTVDPDGGVVFSDRPPPPGTPVETIDLPAPNTLPPLDEASATGAPSADLVERANPYRSLRVTDPPHEAAIRDNAGNVMITAALEPALLPGHELHVYTNGVLRQRSQSARIPLMHLDRGIHQVELRVVDAAGSTIIASEPSVFHLHRRSVILQPAARR